MRKRFGVALLAVPLLALPAWAHNPFAGCAPCMPFKINTGFDFHFKYCGPNNAYGAQLGPWYNYWPLEAHFQVPAMPCYPYWPAPMTLPGAAAAAGFNPYGGYHPPATAAAPAVPAAPAAVPTLPPPLKPTAALEPVGYR